MTIHDDILAWSLDQPHWQRDALRRIIEKGSFDVSDTDELTAACREAYGLSEDSAPELTLLATEHIPSRQRSDRKITLCSISEAANVNALDSNQLLSFAATGLTVVFGYNGSGKSGYGRILRRACRARSKGAPILPNVMGDAATAPASAVITTAVDDAEQPPAQWIDGQQSPDGLGAISFFDSDCASVHVRDKNEVAFTPFGLEILPTLGDLCKSVQAKLNAEKRILEGETPPFLRNSYATGNTKVGTTLSELKGSTKPEDLDTLASLNDAELERLKEIPVQLAFDPQKAAKDLRVQAGRITTLGRSLAAAEKALSDEVLAAIKALASDAAAKTKAAQVAAAMNFNDDPLDGIGEPVWRALWEAARRYSTDAIPDTGFPATDTENAVCVLCQQPLAEDAKDRLERFEKFVRDDSAQQATKATTALTTAVTALDRLDLQGEGTREQMKDVEAIDAKVFQSVRDQLATLLRRLRAVKLAYESSNWSFETPGTLNDVTDHLVALIKTLGLRAAEIDKSADATERKRLTDELAELKAREWLTTVLGDVKEHVSRLADISKLKKAIAETKTNAITTKSKELAKLYVTDQLRNAFADEINKMQQGVRRLNVELAAAEGKHGRTFYRVQLVGASNAQVGTIVSEGEHRCIALAGFLSELATEPTKSTVVFDDPVTSLDHHWRGCFAQRLVEESANRQVVVFTHDIVFLHDLLDGASRSGLPVQIQQLAARQATAGIVESGLPWDARSVAARIDTLEKDTRAAQTLYDNHEDEAYKAKVEGIYGRLRATIEKVVEDQIFCRVVVRHRDYINLKDLPKTVAVTAQHCERVKNLFSKCCDITDAHHRSPSRGFSVPSPADVLHDIAELSGVVDDVKTDQRSIV
ncbi:AAA family ATPase [Rosistilla carotiformis]|nr:AAA family ATPase [Rosistilla carotiformis]